MVAKVGTPDLAEYYYVGKKWRFGIPTQRPLHSGGRVRTIRFSAVLRRHGSYHLAPPPFTNGETEARRDHVPMALRPAARMWQG